MDTKLKQRLIGGAVLIALAVIFLPMLVQGPAPDSGVGDVPAGVPAAPTGKFETRELPLGPAAGQAVLPAPVTAPTPAPVSTVAAEPDAVPATQPAPPDPAVAAGQWAVSFGAYASARDADAVLSRLRQTGLEGFKEEADLNGRQAWRVRVGPYPDRALAEAGRLQAVRIRNDVNAQVIALDAVAGPTTTTAVSAAIASKPVTAAPAPAPAPHPEAARPLAKPTATVTDPPASKAAPAAVPVVPAPSAPAASGVGFAVQMGAFASEAEANALRDRLRAAGYSSLVQPVRTDKGTLSRVRVGPVSSRAEAEQLKSRLAGSFGAGMVVPHP